MTIARRKQLCLEITPVYHCITRCVRRSFLCGNDNHSGRNYNHRRAWIEDRILLLTKVFCIDIAAYAILSNHYHLVLRINLELVDSLSDDEVINRWLKLYKGPELMQRYAAGEPITELEMKELKAFSPSGATT